MDKEARESWDEQPPDAVRTDDKASNDFFLSAIVNEDDLEAGLPNDVILVEILLLLLLFLFSLLFSLFSLSICGGSISEKSDILSLSKLKNADLE